MLAVSPETMRASAHADDPEDVTTTFSASLSQRARLLRGGMSSVVLMFTPGLQRATDFVSAAIINQLGAALVEHGLHLVWQLGDVDDSGPSADLAPVVVLSSAAEGDDVYDGLRDHFDVPVLSAYPGLEGFIAAGATAQVEHLYDRGRRHLAFAASNREELVPTAQMRWVAATEAAHKLGMNTPPRLTLPEDRAEAATHLQGFLDQHPDIDAVCAYNDEVAFAVLAAASDCGVAVPDQLAVIGIDNHPFGPVAIPALSTVQSDVSEFVTAFAASIAGVARGDEAMDIALPDRAQAVTRASS